jgi:hypothetical protein
MYLVKPQNIRQYSSHTSTFSSVTLNASTRCSVTAQEPTNPRYFKTAGRKKQEEVKDRNKKCTTALQKSYKV